MKRDIQLSYLMVYNESIFKIEGDNMPSTKEYLSFILEQLSDHDGRIYPVLSWQDLRRSI